MKLFFFIFILLIVSCNDLNKKDVKMNKLTFQCDSDFINKSNVNSIFYSNLKDDKKGYTFFTVNIIDTKIDSLLPENYLVLVYETLLADDTLEIFKEYRLNRLTAKNKIYYLGEFVTEIESEKYMYYMALVKLENKIYEFGLKCLICDKEKYYSLFIDILYSSRLNDKIIFEKEVEIEAEQIVLGKD